MKKIWVAVSLLTLISLFPAFPQGELKLSGYMVAGASANLTDSTIEFSKRYSNGLYYSGGELFARIRIGGSYDNGRSGILFAYQAQKDLFDSSSWTAANLKYAQVYARFFDNMVVAEAGILTDRYTISNGMEQFNLCQYATERSRGVRLVAFPVKGLAVAAQVSDQHCDTNDEGETELNKNLLAFSAKYATDAFAITGGYHFAGDAYLSFELFAVKNLKFSLESRYYGENIYQYGTDALTLVENIEYSPEILQGFSFGLYAHQYLIDDDSKVAVPKFPGKILTEAATRFEFTPHAQYMFNDLYGVQAESTVTYYTEASDDEADFSIQATGALLYVLTKMGKGARLFYTISRDVNRDIKNYLGLTIRTNL